MPVLREFSPEDSALLVTATLCNLNWCGERFTVDDVITRSEFRHYTTMVPERGDFGFVAEVSGTPVGVVWALYLPSDDRGYGYLDDRTPELSVWVAPDHRGRGLGRELLARMQDEARRREVAAISLSVEQDNFAKALYHSAGFAEVSGREADGVMVWRA